MKKQVKVLMLIVILLNLLWNTEVFAAHVSGCSGTGTRLSYSSNGSSTHKVNVYCTSCDGWLYSSQESHSISYTNNGLGVSHTAKCSKCTYSSTTSHSYAGYKYYSSTHHRSTCGTCGSYYSGTHSYTGTVTTAATCTSTGVMTYKCGTCGHSYTETIAKTDHTSNGYWYKANDSQHYTKCSVCSVAFNYGNHWENVAATCTTAAKCGTCSGYYGSALGHNPGTAATCTSAQTCTRCGETITAALGHNPGTAATCTSAQTCTRCGETITAALGHNPGTAATCTSAQTCTRCGETITAALGHNPGTAATCTSAQTCTRCGTTLANALGHNESSSWSKDASNHWKVCTRCSTITTSKTAHTWNSGEVTTAATCSDTGSMKYTCTVCSQTKTETIAKLSHIESSWQYNDSQHWKYCTRSCCGSSVITTAKANHADTDSNGYCDSCGYEMTVNGYITLSSSSGSITYGTSSKTFTVSSHHGGSLTVAETTSTAATVSISGTTVTIANLASLDAGTTVTIKVTSGETAKYFAASATYTLTVNKAAGSVVLSPTSGTLTYPTSGTTTVTTNKSGGTLSVSSSNSAVATASVSGTTVTIAPGTTAGTATITVTSASTKNYNAASATYTATVKNGTLSVSASGYTGTYDGNPHGISVSCSGATITYATSSTGTYSATNPTYTNAGTYTTYYKVVKAGYTTVTGSKTVTINKANISPTVSMSGYTYGGTKSTPSVSGNSGSGTVTYYYSTSNSNSGGTAWSNVTSSTYLNAGTYYMYATVGETTNYNTATTSAVKFVISRANISPTVNMSGYAYAGTKSTPSVSGNSGSGTVTYYYSTSNSNSGGTAWTNVTSSTYLTAGTYYMYATVGQTTNYNSATTSAVKFVVSKGTITPTVSMTGYTYGGTKNNPSISGNTENGTVTYYYNTSNSNSGGTAWTKVTSSTYLNAGTYYMYATVGETTNYNAATSATKQFTVARADITPVVSITGYTYGGTKNNPTISGNTGNGTVTYYYNTTNSNSGGTAWTNVTSSTSLNAGTYYMYATVGQTTNYVSKTSATVQFTIARANISPTVNMSGYTYGGTKSTPTVSGNSGSGTVTYYYSTSNSNSGGTAWSNVTSSKYLNAGTYYMYATVGQTTNYNAATTPAVQFVVSRANISPTVNMSGYTYAGTKSTPTVSGNSGSGTVTYYYNTTNSNSGGTAWTNVTSSTYLTAGTYYMYATVGQTTNYNSATTPAVQFVVARGNITPVVSMTGYTYGGTKTSPSISGNIENGTVTYYYNTANSNSGGTEWSKVTSSTYLTAGTYYMYATVGQTTNYNAATSATKAFTISKAAISPTVNMTNYTYDGTKPTPTVNGNIENGTVTYYYNTTNSNSGGTPWANVTSSKYLNAGTYYMYAFVDTTANYASATTPAVKFEIARANISPTVNMTNYTYDGTKPTPTVNGNIENGTVTYYYNTTNSNSGGTAWTNVTSSKYLNAGTYYMYATVAQTTNYNAATTPAVKFEIARANISPTVNMTGYTYGGTKSTPTVSGNIENGTVTYYYSTSNSNSGGTAWTSIGDSTDLNAGTYYMYATVGQTTNYNAATTPAVKFTIAVRQITLTWGNTAFLFTALPQLPTATWSSGVADETLNISIATPKTDVGDYTATATLNSVTGGQANTANYNLTNPTIAFTIRPDPSIKFNVTIDKDYFVWDTTAHEPKETVKATVSGTVYTLVKDRDYTVTYKNNIEPGTATIVITGINNYGASSAEVNYTIDKATRVINVIMNDYYYASTVPTPKLDNNNEPGLTTYYVTSQNTNAGGNPWSDVKDAKYLDAGIYYIYAEIGETTHYKALTTPTTEFEIFKAIAKHPDVENKIYNGKPQIGVTNAVGVILTGVVEATDVGTYTAYGTLSNNYVWADGEGVQQYTWTISPCNITSASIRLDPYVLRYTGTPREPEVIINLDGFELVKDRDFTVSFKNNIEVGTAEAIISGINNFTGSLTDTFEIKESTIDKIELDKIEYEYTGYEIRPIEKVYDIDGNLLIKDKDYTVYYTNNVEVGTALIGVVGKGNYTGNIEAEYAIIGESLENAKVTLIGLPYIYDGKEKCPEAEVVLNRKTLERGRDYEISYENNINAGENTAVAVITGVGAYDGEVRKTFTIFKADRKATILPGKAILLGETGELKYSYEGEIGATTLIIQDTSIAQASNKTYGRQDSIDLTGLKVGRSSLQLIVAETDNYNELVLKSEVAVFETIEDAYPIYGDVVINDDDEYTVTPKTILTLNVDFGDYMYISESNVTPDIDDSEWYEFSRKIPYVFSDTEGEKIIYVWFKDKLGNMSSVATDDIILDYDADIPAHDNVMLDQTNIDTKAPGTEYDKYNNSNLDIKVVFKQEDVMVNGIRSGVDHTTIRYGYKEAESTADYIWQTSPIVKGLEYNKKYAFVTQAYDRAGNGVTTSEETIIQTERKYETTITLKDTNIQYDGKVHPIPEADFKLVNGVEITGDVIYTYYVDEDCTIPTTPNRDGSTNQGGAPSKPGIYYVKVELTNDNVYYDTESNVAELRIGWDISKGPGDDVFAYVERTNPDSDEYILNVIGEGSMADLDDLLISSSDESKVYWVDFKEKIVELEIINKGNESITNIGAEIFNNLPKIEEIVIPDTITSIGEYAFEGCTGVTEKIVIPSSVEEIGSGAFVNVNTPEFEVEYGNQNYDTIDGVLTDDEHKELISYPNGKTDSKYTIPDTIETIKESAFSGADNLTDVVIPNGVEVIEVKAFYDCPNLEVIEIEDLMDENDNVLDLTTVGSKAFENIAEDSIIYTFSEHVAEKFIEGKTHVAGKTEVYWPPVITVHPIDMNGALSTTVKFIVEAEPGYPENINYQWFKVKDDVESVISGATNSEYTTPTLGSNNDGDEYYCRVYNDQYYYDRGFVNSNKGKITMISSANYIVERGTYNSYLFETLKDSFDFAISGDVIKPLKSVANEESATLSGGKAVTFNLNNVTVNMKGIITVDNGSKIELTGGGTLNKASKEYIIENKGELVLNGGLTVRNDVGYGIKAEKDSVLELTRGTISANNNAVYVEDAQVTVNGANITVTTSEAKANAVSLYGATKFEMTAGNISIGYNIEMTDGNLYGIYIDGNAKAKAEISGGTVKATSTTSPADAIANGGKSDVVISGTADIEGSRSGIITLGSNSYGDVLIEGGTVTGGEFGVLNNATAATIVFGKKGNGVSVTKPVVVGEKAAIFNTKENNTLEFYDGVIYSHSANVIYEELNNTNLELSVENVDSVYTEEGRDYIVTENGFSIAVEENVSYNSSTYKKAYLAETKPPVLSGLRDVTVEEGETAPFEIIPSGGQPDHYEFEWEVSTDGGITWTKVTVGSGYNTNKYTTPIATKAMDGYRYRCIVSNEKIKIVSDAVTLTVISKDDMGEQRPVVRILFTDGRVITTEGDKKLVNMQIVIKSFEKLSLIEVNDEKILEMLDGTETAVDYEYSKKSLLELTKAPGSPVEIKKVINGEEKVVEYTYTYNMKVYANDVITVDVKDVQNRTNTATQTVDLFGNLRVHYYLSELTQSNSKLTVTFYANKPVKPTKSLVNSYINSTYLDLVALDNAEYSYRYILTLSDPLPETEFWFEDQYRNEAKVTVAKIDRVEYKDIKFNTGTLDIEDLNVIEAYGVAQELESAVEVNANEEVQSRYGLNSVQSDVFMSRARDLGAIDILNGSTTAKSYDGVFTKNIEATVASQDSSYNYMAHSGNIFVAAAAKYANDNELSTEEAKYIDIITKEIALYKGMNISGFKLDDVAPYMYKGSSSTINIDDTTAEAAFRATIIAK